jgi:Fe-Mn family superoxide dismutase
MATYTLPDLPYDYAALEPAISGEILELHHDKHHAAYVKGANDTLEQLAETRDTGQFGTLVGLEKTLAFNLSGHVLHSIFWQNLSGDGGDRPGGALAEAIDEHFGSFDAFAGQLTAATTGVQGSGWGILAWEPLGRRLIVQQVYDHHGNIGQATVPLLSSMPGSTPTTSSTATSVPTTSAGSGTWSTGPTSSPALRARRPPRPDPGCL